MNLGYWLYMNEAEGCDHMVDTRLAKINAIGKELVRMGYKGGVVPGPVFASLLKKHKIEDISQKEIDDIEKRWL